MYKVKFNDKAAKSLSKIDNKIQQKIISYLEQPALLKNPKTFGKALLGDKKGSWRYRVNDYRIICHIIEKELIVLALDIGHRKEIYRT
ncbi:MAG: type II toxin-antitoxin system RelE/ParE family toxin [Proteobacteria bacterium]|nr:type II toxin-antitoxin system RelE/ParE family toxin [Pseudomonadota bacterium]